jgi:chromosomal replication initiation ATPase DnaA
MNYWIYPGLEHKSRILALNASKSSRADLNGLLDCCCFIYDTTPEEIRGPLRIQNLALARHAFVKIARDHSGLPWQSIADYLGKRNHATAMNSYRQAEALIETDRYFRQQYNRIKAMLTKAVTVEDAIKLMQIEIK